MNKQQPTFFWIGIDLSKATFDAAIATEGTPNSQRQKLPSQQFQNTPQGHTAFALWVSEQMGSLPCAGLCLEDTGIYTPNFIRALAALPQSTLPAPSAVNPVAPKAFAKSLHVRDKSDRIDACVIALYALRNEPKPRPEREQSYRELRALHRLRASLVLDRTAWKNRLESAEPATKKHTLALIDLLSKQIEAVVADMEELLKTAEQLAVDYSRLQTIPGIGKVIAVMLLAEYGDLRTWKRGQVVSYAGLFARSHESGTSVRSKPRLAKGGGKDIRAKLYMGVVSLLRWENPFTGWQQKLEKNGLCKMATIGALMRKLLVTARAVIRSEKDFDPNFLLA